MDTSLLLGKHFDSYNFFARYLVDSRWFKQWQNYVGYLDYYLLDKGKKTSYPGPIDNTSLFKGKFRIHLFHCETDPIFFGLFPYSRHLCCRLPHTFTYALQISGAHFITIPIFQSRPGSLTLEHTLVLVSSCQF